MTHQLDGSSEDEFPNDKEEETQLTSSCLRNSSCGDTPGDQSKGRAGCEHPAGPKSSEQDQTVSSSLLLGYREKIHSSDYSQACNDRRENRLNNNENRLLHGQYRWLGVGACSCMASTGKAE